MDAQAIALELAHQTFAVFRAVTPTDLLQHVLESSSKRVRAGDAADGAGTARHH